MTRHTYHGRRVVVRRTLVAGQTTRLAMRAQQGKAGFAVIEVGTLPGLVVVAFSAIGAEAAFMRIIAPVTAHAVLGRLLEVLVFMTGRTLGL